MKELTDIEKSYFAGLFDGEGCVLITENHGNSYILNIVFGLTYKPILEKMKKYFYGYIYKEDMEKRENSTSAKAQKSVVVAPKKYKQSYDYHLNSRDAWIFLKVIEPFCHEKKSQVQLAINYYSGKKPNSTSPHETERSKFYMKELQRMKRNESDSEVEVTDFEDNQMDLTCFLAEGY